MKALLTTNIQDLEKEIMLKKEQLSELRKRNPLTKIKDYDLVDFDNNIVKLSDLFGDKDELVVVHNMGTSCAWCTMWADGFNGIYKYIEAKAAFVVMSPNKPEEQQAFYTKKGWQFKMISTYNSTFRQDLGFEKDGEPEPGISSFVKKDNQIYLANSAQIGPHDNFCAVYDIWDLLHTGWTEDWDNKNTPKVAFN